MQKEIRSLFISNLTFVATYTLLATHVLFLHGSASSEVKSSVYIGLGIFNALQVGGIWILQTLFGDFAFRKMFIVTTRLLAIVLILLNNQTAIIISYTLFGLSSASFYKISRNVLKDINLQDVKNLKNPFLIFSLSTNIAFMTMPIIGSFLIDKTNIYYSGILINISLLLISIYQMSKVNIIGNQEAQIKSSTIENTESFQFFDAVRIVMIFMPYTIMMTIPPLKAISLGLNSQASSLIYTVNGFVVIAIQLTLSKTKFFDFTIKRFDASILIASIVCLLAIFSSWHQFILLYIIWTITESYQIPALEYLLFSKRKYTSQTINRVLVIDSMTCLLGPIIGSNLI